MHILLYHSIQNQRLTPIKFDLRFLIFTCFKIISRFYDICCATSECLLECQNNVTTFDSFQYHRPLQMVMYRASMNFFFIPGNPGQPNQPSPSVIKCFLFILLQCIFHDVLGHSLYLLFFGMKLKADFVIDWRFGGFSI